MKKKNSFKVRESQERKKERIHYQKKKRIKSHYKKEIIL